MEVVKRGDKVIAYPSDEEIVILITQVMEQRGLDPQGGFLVKSCGIEGGTGSVGKSIRESLETLDSIDRLLSAFPQNKDGEVPNLYAPLVSELYDLTSMLTVLLGAAREAAASPARAGEVQLAVEYKGELEKVVVNIGKPKEISF